MTAGSCAALVMRAVRSRNDVPGGLKRGRDSSAGDSLSGPVRVKTATVVLAGGASAAERGRTNVNTMTTRNAASRRSDMIYLE